jgi:hypothetical protein
MSPGVVVIITSADTQSPGADTSLTGLMSRFALVCVALLVALPYEHAAQCGTKHAANLMGMMPAFAIS